MQVGGVNVSPESSQHMLVSLNGVIQKNGGTNPSFTVSGSTITFASNLVTGDVIDFIQILGNVLDLGVPSDSTVSLAKLTATGTKDATTFLRGDNTFASAGSPSIVDNGNATAMTINSNEQVEFIEGTASLPSITKSGNTDTGIFFPRAFGEVAISSQGNEVMRLGDSGQVAFLKDDFDAAGSTTNRCLEIRANGATAVVLEFDITQTTNATVVNFNNGNGGVGTIQLNGTATSYNTSSDYRLKENVNYDFDATTRLKQLKPARFNFIADDTKIVDGFIAHEVSSVVPEAISGEKDAVKVWQEGEKLPEGVSVGDNKLDADGNTIIEAQGIDQSKLVPLLVKTIQELEARITQLENA
jgi:hypothetical protein